MTGMLRTASMTALLFTGLAIAPTHSLPQVVGEKAELGRLQVKADEAIANDDPDGAAMMMGRAALLAGQLGKRQSGWSADLHKNQEALFRSQEHTYRALALFRRAGGQLPASSGVCGSLALAQTSLNHVAELKPGAAPDASLVEEATRLRTSASAWQEVLTSMIAEYQCP